MPTELSARQIATLLEHSYYGHLACTVEGELYVVPTTFVYKNGVLYAYTLDGKKTAMMRKNPHVCLQTERVHDDGGWESVIVWGTFSEITDRAESQKACLMLADEFAAYDTADHPIVSPLIREISRFDWETDIPVVYKITVEKSTGRSQDA